MSDNESATSATSATNWWSISKPISTSEDPRTKCIEEFQLISPDEEDSEAWSAYYSQRKVAIGKFSPHIDMDGEDFMYAYIEEGLCGAFSGLGLEDKEWETLHDCVVPLDVEGDCDGNYNLSSARAISRIYSPVRTTAVDVFLEYIYRERYSSYEFNCNIYYKPHEELTSELEIEEPETNRKMNGFKRIFELAPKSKKFGMSKAGLTSLHKLLFGAHDIGKKMDRVALIHLLLGSVGYTLTIARKEKENDYQTDIGDIVWDEMKGKEAWLASHFRKVAGLPALKRDAKHLK